MEKTVKEIIELCAGIEPTYQFDVDSLFDEFGLYHYDFDYSAIDSRITAKYFDRWICWDTPVGKCLVYFDDVPVAITVQSARKSDIEWFWLGKDYAKSVESFLMTFKTQTDNRTYISVDTIVPLEGDEIRDSRSANFFKEKMARK